MEVQDIQHLARLAFHLRTQAHRNPQAVARPGELFINWDRLHLFMPSTPYEMMMEMRSKLPAEVQDMVIPYLKGTVTGSLLQTQYSVLKVLPKLQPYHYSPRPPRLCASDADHYDSDKDPHGSGQFHLRAHTSTILGPIHITKLEKLEKECEDSIPVDTAERPTIQCARSDFGLRAVRTISSRGSVSRWLGDPKSTLDCWIGTFSASNRNLGVLAGLSDVSALHSSLAPQASLVS